jgi:hypothetical protein
MDRTFFLLIVVQAAHSGEEYYGRLYDVFPPARIVSGLISANRQRGFVVFNLALILFGVWCLIWPVRHRWPSAAGFIWLWVGIEVLNGIGHPAWSIVSGGYTPGVATAPILLVLASSLAVQLLRSTRAEM